MLARVLRGGAVIACLRIAVLAGCFAFLGLAAPADATFPGANGKIAFERGADIWTMNPDGTDQVNLTNTSATEHDPNWSPDGSKIVFKDGTRGFFVMNADGSGVTDLGSGPTPDFYPAWSPDGTKIAFSAQTVRIVAMMADNPGFRWEVGRVGQPGSSTNERPDWSPDGERIAWTVWCDGDFGSGQTSYVAMAPAQGGGPVERVTSANECPSDASDLPYSDGNPSWSPDAQRILFGRGKIFGPDPSGLYSIRPDGTGKTLITTAGSVNAVWSPDGSKIAYENGPGTIGVMNADGTGRTNITTGTVPDWQPIPINSYPRPRGATPMRLPLVPASKACTTPNSTHGAPLSYGSCTPPQLTSGQLTTGTPDSNGKRATMDGYLLLSVMPGDSSTPAVDEADVSIAARVTNVFKQDLSDYTGALRVSLPLRITDKNNNPAPGGPGAATTQPFQYDFNVPCTATADPQVGSDCALTTTADSLTPGTILEGRRAIWQIGRARVDDAGPDGNPGTATDNTVFAVQGVFIP
jgi:WD40 repeat protein